MSWIKDHCDEFPQDISERRAAAILRRHRKCTPHCERFLGALLFAPIPAYLAPPRFLR